MRSRFFAVASYSRDRRTSARQRELDRLVDEHRRAGRRPRARAARAGRAGRRDASARSLASSPMATDDDPRSCSSDAFPDATRSTSSTAPAAATTSTSPSRARVRRAVARRAAPPRQRRARGAARRRHHPRAPHHDERNTHDAARPDPAGDRRRARRALHEGHAAAPGCAATRMRALQALWNAGAPITTVDILPDPQIRQELSALSDWPTIPQVFVKRRADRRRGHHRGAARLRRARRGSSTTRSGRSASRS